MRFDARGFQKSPELFHVLVTIDGMVFRVGTLHHQKFTKQLISISYAIIVVTFSQYLGGLWPDARNLYL